MTIDVRLLVLGFAMFAASSGAMAGPAANSYTLSVDEQRELRTIVKRDEYFARVNEKLKIIDNLMNFASKIAPGPAKLTLSWNRGTWNGFSTGMKGVEKISNLYTCGVVMVAAEGHYFPNTNLDFWSDMYVFRNCP